MGDPLPNPNPDPSSQSRRTSQSSERTRSRDSSQPLLNISEDVLRRPPHRGSRGSQGSQDLGSGLPQLPQRSSLISEHQGDEGTDYQQSMNFPSGFPGEFLPPAYLDESRMMQFPQGQGLLEQLESSYQDTSSGLMGQFNMYPGEEQLFNQAAHHGPYLRDDPTLNLGPSDLGFMPFMGEMPDPEPRELAVQNAKAYLLQTSVSCNLSL